MLSWRNQAIRQFSQSAEKSVKEFLENHRSLLEGFGVAVKTFMGLTMPS